MTKDEFTIQNSVQAVDKLLIAAIKADALLREQTGKTPRSFTCTYRPCKDSAEISFDTYGGSQNIRIHPDGSYLTVTAVASTGMQWVEDISSMILFLI